MTAQLEVPDQRSIPTARYRRTPTGPSNLTRIGLGVLLLGGFLPILDFFIVNVALPRMNTTLHASEPMLELVVAGYGVAYALMLVVGGRLGDALGRRAMFGIGITGFTLSSLLCGIAPNIGLLVVFRVLQGVSAAMSQPQVLATFHATLDGPRRAQAIGLYGAMAGVASAAGQLVGGVLVDANIAGLSWRPIFLVNVPVGIAVLLVMRRLVPATRSPNPASVDRLGTALLGITMLALLIPLTEGRAVHWAWWTWVLLALAPLAAVATVLVERRVERGGRTPLLPPALLRLPSVHRGMILAIPFFMGFSAFMFVFALTLQDGLHQDALRSGLAITPMMVSFFIGSLIAPRLLARFGVRVLAVGLVAQAVALVWLILTVSAEWPHVSFMAMAPSLFLAGLGQAFGFVSIFRLVLSDVPDRLAGIGSGLMVTVQQASIALGVASLGSLYLSLAATDPRRAFSTVIAIQAGIAVVVAIGSLWLRASRKSAPAAAAAETLGTEPAADAAVGAAEPIALEM